MSSSSRRSALSRGGAALLALTVGGCVEPLYGTLGQGRLEQELQAIRVEPIHDRFGHYVAQELIFALNGSGAQVTPKYALVVTLKQRVQSPVVDTVTSRATAASLIADAEFVLRPLAGGAPITGVAFSVASYDRFSQRISNVRAARDAEIRDAKVIADQIRNQISARLADAR